MLSRPLHTMSKLTSLNCQEWSSESDSYVGWVILYLLIVKHKTGGCVEFYLRVGSRASRFSTKIPRESAARKLSSVSCTRQDRRYCRILSRMRSFNAFNAMTIRKSIKGLSLSIFWLECKRKGIDRRRNAGNRIKWW